MDTFECSEFVESAEPAEADAAMINGHIFVRLEKAVVGLPAEADAAMINGHDDGAHECVRETRPAEADAAM